jgi:hypothetical protein
MGEATVPVILLGRYTTLAGSDPFVTSPILVAEYSAIELGVWRGPMDDLLGLFEFELEESMDQVTWTMIDSTGVVPPGTETPMSTDLSRAWLRAKVRLNAASFPVVTCYAVGFLLKRRT